MYTNSNHTSKFRYAVLLIFVGFSLSAFSQDSLHNVNNKIAEDHCISGHGNGTFKITLSQLERVISGKFNQSALIKILPQYACQYKLSFNGNPKTMDFDIPQFEFAYHYLNPQGIVVVATIEGSINNKIGHLQVNNIPGTAYDNLLAALTKNGYLYRESISHNGDKHFYNKTKSLVVILRKGGYPQSFSVSIN